MHGGLFMRKWLCAFFLTICLLTGVAIAEAAECTLSAPGTVTGFAENPIVLTVPQAGTVTLALQNDLGRECLRIATDAPIVPGTNTFSWDGLGYYQEQLERMTYTLTAHIVTPAETYDLSQPVRVGLSRQAVVMALANSRVLYQGGGQSWFTEVKLIRKGTLCIAYYRADNLENCLYLQRKEIGNYRIHNHKWDGKLHGKAVVPGDYVLRFYAEESPDIVLEVAVTVVAGAYVSPALTVSDAYLPSRNATDAELWAWMQQPITVSTLKNLSHQKLYAAPDRRSKSPGTIHGQSQGVQVLEPPANGWVKVGAYTHESGAWTEGYVQADRLTTIPPQGDYGLLLDKQAQTLAVFYQGERLATFSISTGLARKGHPEYETPAGMYLTLEHMQDYSLAGNNYDHVIRYDGGNLLHQCAYRMRQGWRDYTEQAELLGSKASHGCIRLPYDGADGFTAYWLWTHVPYGTKLIIWEE